MRIMVFGVSIQIYMYQFIRLLQPLAEELMIIDIAETRDGLEERRRLNASYRKMLDFYSDGHIRIITKDELTAGGYIQVIAALGRFDVCHIQYMEYFTCEIVSCLSGQFNCIIANYLGSDLLRASRNLLEAQGRVLKQADYIVADSDSLIQGIREVFGSAYEEKLRLIRFMPPLIEEIDRIGQDPRVPKRNKLSLACGYNASMSQQHKMFLEALHRLSDRARQRIKVIFPMTYGGDAEGVYISGIREKLKKEAVEYQILETYLSDEEMAQIWMDTDIIVHIQTTDANSSAMLEALYCGAVALCGEWIPSIEYDRYGISHIKVRDMHDLTAKLERIIENYDAYAGPARDNRNKIRDYIKECGPEKWKDLYANIPLKKKKDTRPIHEAVEEFAARTVKARFRVSFWENWRMFRQEGGRLTEAIGETDRRIILYGAGTIGQALLTQLELENQEVDVRYCDSDEKKLEWGARPVLHPEDLEDADQYDKVIIVPMYSYRDIKDRLLECKVPEEKIIPLDHLFAAWSRTNMNHTT